jgi:hypothetical protein
MRASTGTSTAAPAPTPEPLTPAPATTVRSLTGWLKAMREGVQATPFSFFRSSVHSAGCGSRVHGREDLRGFIFLVANKLFLLLISSSYCIC